MKKFLLGIVTFIIMLVLIFDIFLFGFKLATSKYINSKKIVTTISDINVADLLVDYDILEMNSIKEDLEASGVPKKKVNAFLTSKPINDYASDVANKTITNTLENNKGKIVRKNEIYYLLEDNIDEISKEKKIFKTEEEQKKFLEKVKYKTPNIENNINRIVIRIQDKMDNEGYTNKLDLVLSIFDLFYGKIANIIIILLFVICCCGIMLTRKSSYMGFKWIGVSFFIVSLLYFVMYKTLGDNYEFINYIPEVFANNIKSVINEILKSLFRYGIVFMVIGAAFININIIYYLGMDKNKSK